MAVADVMKKIKQEKVKFIDLRFTDTKGKEQHVSVPTAAFDKNKFTELNENMMLNTIGEKIKTSTIPR